MPVHLGEGGLITSSHKVGGGIRYVGDTYPALGSEQESCRRIKKNGFGVTIINYMILYVIFTSLIYLLLTWPHNVYRVASSLFIFCTAETAVTQNTTCVFRKYGRQIPKTWNFRNGTER